MMRLAILGFLTFLQTPGAQAATNAFFSQDGTTATVLLTGRPGDADTVGLWDALKVPVEDFQGKWSKRLSLPGPDGGKGFDIACIFSKAIPGNGTCTLIFHAAPGMVELSRDQGKMQLWLEDEAAGEFAKLFVIRDESAVVFRSQDGRLNISLVREQEKIRYFVVNWKGRGI